MQVNESAVSTHVAGKASRQIGCREVASGEGDDVMQAHVGERERSLHDVFFLHMFATFLLSMFLLVRALDKFAQLQRQGFRSGVCGTNQVDLMIIS